MANIVNSGGSVSTLGQKNLSDFTKRMKGRLPYFNAFICDLILYNSGREKKKESKSYPK